MPCVLRIVEWDQNFENSKTRAMKGPLRWVPIPTKHDGDGYTELLGEPDGSALYGCWVAIVALAAKCPTRGTLTRSRNVPHDMVSISRITRVPEETVKRCLEVAISRLGWITCKSVNDNGLPSECPGPDGCVYSAKRESVPIREGKGKEGKGKEGREGDSPETAARRQQLGGQLQAVWRFYKTKRPRARTLTKKYRTKIQARLREGFTVADLREAIEGNYASDFHCGRGPRSDGTEFHDLDLICRSADHVEKFIGIARRSRGAGNNGQVDSPATRATREAVNRFSQQEMFQDGDPNQT